VHCAVFMERDLWFIEGHPSPTAHFGSSIMGPRRVVPPLSSYSMSQFLFTKESNCCNHVFLACGEKEKLVTSSLA